MSELPPPLCAKNRNSFAFDTVKNRLPVILTKVIDTCHKEVNRLRETYGEKAVEDAKAVIGELSKFRNHWVTDKPFEEFKDNLPDVEKWNQCFRDQKTADKNELSAFESPWLFSECFLYRKIASILNQSEYLKDFDPFKTQKETALKNALPGLSLMGDYLEQFCNSENENDLSKQFEIFLKSSLWSNRFDLSLSAGEHREQDMDPTEALEKLESYILIDDSNIILNHLKKRREKGEVCVDIVLDNAGFEFGSDLIFAEFLLASKLADFVRFHVKNIPWFVSDVTMRDVEATLDTFSGSAALSLAKYGKIWKRRINEGSFRFLHGEDEEFWTLPLPYFKMRPHNPSLYKDLATSSLIIFKGDLNFRKIVGDLNWDPETPFLTALSGFTPAPLCVLRTQKADVVVGLRPGQAESAEARDEDWMVAGKYAVIQAQLDL